MKKIISALLAVVMVFSLVCVLPKDSELVTTVSAQYGDEITEGSFSFIELSNGTLALKSYSGTEKSVTVPKTVGGKTVTELSEDSFKAAKDTIESVTLPSTITRIEKFAFNGLEKLKSVNCLGAVTEIGNYAFYNCIKLETFTIPKTVTNIGLGAFSGCDALKSIEIPDSVTTIQREAFNSCTSLSSITFGKNVKNFGRDAFKSTKWLQNARNKYSSHLVIVNGVLVDAMTTELGTVKLTDNITAIGDGAFYDNTKITSVVIPSSVRSIGVLAFANCKNLASVTIPSSVTYLGENVFYDSKYLTELRKKNPLVIINNIVIDGSACKGAVTIPSGVTRINPDTFDYNKELTSVTIPGSVKSIGESAFEHCSALTTVKLSSGLTSIEERAFYQDSALSSINFPSTLKTIGMNAFHSCSSLKSVSFPNSITYIGANAFRECTGLTSITLPNSAATLDSYAFMRCISVESLTVPGKLKLGEFCFADMTSVKTLVLQEGITTLSQYVFYDLNSMTDVKLPKSLKTIENRAFCLCSSLKHITIPDNVESIGKEVFAGCSRLDTVNIPPRVKTIGENAVSKYYSVPTIICARNSAAEKFAKENNFKVSYYEVSTARIYGNTRYGTASMVAEKAYPNGCDSIVIASGTSYADALAGVPLANALKAPILLSTPAGLDNTTIARIKALKPKSAYILGGTGAVPANVRSQLTELGVSDVHRLSGANRYETAVNIANSIGTVKTIPKSIFIANATAFPDALSASAAAAISNAAILYVNSNGNLDKDTADYLDSIKSGIQNIYIIGGKSLVPDSAVKELSKYCISIKRLSGANRYATNAAVNEEFYANFGNNRVCVVTGKDFPDALTAGVYAAKTQSALILADQSLVMETKKYLMNKCPMLITAIGGTGAVPKDILDRMVTVVKAGW